MKNKKIKINKQNMQYIKNVYEKKIYNKIYNVIKY